MKSVAVAALVAVAAAHPPKHTTTSSVWADWEDVTTTTPEVVPSQPTTTSSAWADWEDVTTTTPEVVPSQPTTTEECTKSTTKKHPHHPHHPTTTKKHPHHPHHPTTTPEVVPEQPTTSSVWADWEDVTTTTPEVVPEQPTTTSAWADWKDVTTTTPEVVPSQPATTQWNDWKDVTTKGPEVVPEQPVTTWTTTIVTEITTYVPYPTVINHNGQTITVDHPSTITITDHAGLKVSVPVVTVTVTDCGEGPAHPTGPEVVPSQPTTTSWVDNPEWSDATSTGWNTWEGPKPTGPEVVPEQPIDEFTGAASKVSSAGAGLAVLAVAAFFL